jgi:type II secretory pathway predicted ATPase ExeA
VATGIPSGELFPTDSPLAPADLIGRDEAVAALADQLAAHTHRILAGPRRTGKTSVCEAALDRLRRDGAYVVAVDLFEQASLGELAEALARELVRNRAPARRALEGLRRGGRTLAEATATSVSARLAGELGEEVEITWRPGVADRDPDRYFDWALKALQKVAEADDRPVILFIDEFQELARERRPYGDADTVTKRMRAVLQRSRRVTCLFAGSMEHLMRDLFTPRHRAFYRFGGFFTLSPIAPEAWADGLRTRFAAGGCTVDDDALAELVALGEGHPRATMLLAQQAHAAVLAGRARRVDLGRVRHGLALALAADAASLDGDLERIRSLGKNSLAMARLVARGERPYGASSAPSASVGRALDALRDAGYIERHGRGDWRVVDPLLRRRLAGSPP